MIDVRRSLLVSAAVFAGTIASAQAADMGGSLKDYGVAPAMPVTYASPASWYIRGDIGVASHDAPTIYAHDATTEYDLTQTKIGTTWTLGGGIGRYLSTNTRADLTVDYRFKSSVSGTQFFTGLGPATAKADLQSTVGLLNFYYDFGSRGSFSPYVGAGIGFVRHTTSGGILVDDCACGIAGTIDSKSRNDLAAALMAGFSVALRTDMHFDAGYRFLYMGKAETGAVNVTAPAPTTVNDPTITDIHAHEFRVGLRYDFGR